MSTQIITTGGTFDKVYHDALSEFSIGQSMVGEILGRARVGQDYQIHALLKKDSLDFTDQDRQLLASTVAASDCNKILIVHGTDTMTTSAAALQQIRDKTIVFTGAMLPARMRDTDAEFNLGFALGALHCLPAGIYIAMHGQIFPAGQVEKNRQQGLFIGKTDDSRNHSQLLP